MVKARNDILGTFLDSTSTMSTRSKALAAFKALHKTRLKILKGDEKGLAAIRERINTEFRKNKDETDSEKVDEFIKAAVDVEAYLSKHMVQAEVIDKGDKPVFKLKLRDEVLTDHTLQPPRPIRTRRPKKCSDDPT